VGRFLWPKAGWSTSSPPTATRLVLAALGARLDTLTEAQQSYRDSWHLGS